MLSGSSKRISAKIQKLGLGALSELGVSEALAHGWRCGCAAIHAVEHNPSRKVEF
jgi:hypothetical protein